MKLVISLIASLIVSSIYSGGVSVGSGQGRVIVGLSIETGFSEEANLILHAEDLITQISNGTNGKVNHMIHSGDCNQSYSKVEELDVTAYFPLEKDEFSFNKKYIGYLTVELKDCLKIDSIVAEERFGWSELWN